MSSWAKTDDAPFSKHITQAGLLTSKELMGSVKGSFLVTPDTNTFQRYIPARNIVIDCPTVSVLWSTVADCSYKISHYRKTPNIRSTKSQNLNDSGLVLQSHLPNPLKPGVKSRMKMLLEQRRQAMLQLHLSAEQFYCLLRCVLYYIFDGMF